MPEPTYAELAAENARLRALLPPDLGSGLTYRVGRRCPENLYVTEGPGEDGFELAKLPTAEYAAHIARALNAWDWGRDHSGLSKLIRSAISDPGSFVPRNCDGEYPESIPHWGMRAVITVLAKQGLTDLKAADL